MLCYFDGTYSQARATGLTRYSDNLLAALDRHPKVANGKLRCVVFGYRWAGPLRVRLQHMETELIPIPIRIHFYSNALTGKPNLTKWFRHQPDVVHYHDVFRFSSDVPGVSSVITVHDVSSLTSVEHYGCKANVIKRRALERIRKSRALVVADSESTRREFLEHCPIDPARVVVVSLGVDSVFLGPERSDASFPSSVGLRNHGYALFVGRYHPRKNVEGILEAFQIWSCNVPVDLALVGPGLWEKVIETSMYKELSPELRLRVHFLGYVSDQQLASLYRSALCLIYPSWHEGFGLPVIEAMACGCPVICSTRGSLAETAGNAAILVEPDDAVSMAQAVVELWTSSDTFERWTIRGRQRANQFTWDAAANRMIQLFERVVA